MFLHKPDFPIKCRLVLFEEAKTKTFNENHKICMVQPSEEDVQPAVTQSCLF